MNTLNRAALSLKVGAGIMMLAAVAVGLPATVGAADPIITERDEFVIESAGNPAAPKSIFVFFDGTANDKSSATNIWRLFAKLKLHRNPRTAARYIEGVGSVSTPLEDDPMFPFLGDALGMGMNARILKGYDFIAQHYNSGDEIFILGFSRGAHQARALAGVLAYAGVPKTRDDSEEQRRKFERILKLVKDARDDEFKARWEAWQPGRPPLLGEMIRDDHDIGLEMMPVEIRFLGVWDTVPGSSFKDYGACKETIGIVKRYFSWLPVISKGERYKSGSYPPIRQIAHAVSLDEKRSKFAPLYLCRPYQSEYTTVTETWFPGAHADVGGGYRDTALPDLSLTWMIRLLDGAYRFASPPERWSDKTSGDAMGKAHWSYGDKPGNLGSHCEDRKARADRQPPLGYDLDSSIAERMRHKVAPIAIRCVKEQRWSYPIACPGPGKCSETEASGAAAAVLVP